MKIFAALLTSLLVAACSSTPKNNTSQASQANEQTPPSATAASATPVSTAESELQNLTSELEQLQKQSAYFDYNKSDIKPQYQSILQKEAAFINAHLNDTVTLEGNADERGSEQYNLILGDKRAEAVKMALEKYGVPAGKIKIVSLGKGKPRLLCHEEKCWKENRRVDFSHKLG